MATTWGEFATTTRTMEDQAWGGTLLAQYLDDPVSGAHPITSASIGGMGAGASVGSVAYGIGSPPLDPGGFGTEDQAEWDAYRAWWDAAEVAARPHGPVSGAWWMFRIVASAPGPTTADHFYCVGNFQVGGVPTWYGPTSLAIGYQAGMTNVVLKARGGDSHPSTRNTRDFIDQHIEYGWFATDTTESTMKVACPDSALGAKGDLSVSGAWASGPGAGAFAASWPATFELTYSIIYAAGTVLDKDYVAITPNWAGVALDLQYLDAYDGVDWWDGADFQDPWPTGTPTWRVYGTGGSIKARRVGGSVANTMSWTAWSRVPYQLQITVHAGKWNDAGGDWSSPILFDAGGLLDDDGNRVYCGIGASGWYTEAQHSWYTENRFSTTVQADVKAGWAAANGEVEADGPALIAGWPLTNGDLSSSGYKASTGMLDIAHGAVNVHKPAGVARPSSYTGTAGAVVTAETDSSLAFTVATGSGGNAQVTRVLTSRWEMQLERLEPPNTDPDLAYDPDWTIKRKANLPTSIPAADPLKTALEAAEDVTDYANHAYLEFLPTIPRVSSLWVRLTYKVASVSDPCYVGWTYRFGPEGEWSRSLGPAQTATYTCGHDGTGLGSATGAQTYYLDLRHPVEGRLGAGKLYYVTQIEIGGFAAPPSGTEAWSIDMSVFKLCDGPEGTTHLAFKNKRAADWTSCFFGLSAWHDGVPILELLYGYLFERIEKGMKYQQYVQHSPGVEATTDPIYAKNLSRLADELNWQEGVTATWTLAGYDADYKDADDVYLFPPDQAKWWWVNWAPDQVLPLGVAPGVRSITIAPGVPTNISVHHYLQGKLHGILLHSSGLYRLRSAGATVQVDDLATGLTVGTYGTDAHGRWVSGPLPELSGPYTVTTGSDVSVAVPAVNRSWSQGLAIQGATGEGGPDMFEDPTGVTWAVWLEGDYIKVNHMAAGYNTWDTPVTVASGATDYSGVSISGNGRVLTILATLTATQKPYSWYSLNRGASWTGPTLAG